MAKKRKERSLFHRIVNSAILFTTGVVFIFIVLIGFSQTKTFREIVRKKVIEIADSTFNGNLYIERIDGSIITSIKLRNTVLFNDRDTLFSARNIELHLSPLHILLKKIYARKIIIEDARIALKENEKDLWNIDSFLGSGEEKDSLISESTPAENIEAESSEFPFKIQINNLQLNNVSFIHKSYEYLDSDEIYDSLEINDLLINEINLSANFIADINEKDFRLSIDNFSANTNFKPFVLNKLQGEFRLNKKFVEVSNFRIVTDSSDIQLSAHLDSLNLFGEVDLANFQNYPLVVNLEAYPFCFDDLSSFIPSTNILKGRPSITLTAVGLFGDFTVTNLQLSYLATEFNLSGKLLNLHTPQDLFLEIEIDKSRASYNDVLKLLPTLELPQFSTLLLEDADITFTGEPTNFSSTFNGLVNGNKLTFDGNLNLDSDVMEYDINFNTFDIDLSPIINTVSAINSSGFIRGKGVNPDELNTQFEIGITDSYFNDYSIDSLQLNANAKNKIIDMNLHLIVNGAEINFNSTMDFIDEIPNYKLEGLVNNLNLESFLHDSLLTSELNFSVSINGKGFDVDSSKGNLNIKFNESLIKETMFDDLIVNLTLDNKERREINFLSNFIDIRLSGEFALSDAVNIIDYEAEEISKIFSGKLSEINPLELKDSINVETLYQAEIPDVIRKKIYIDYSFVFKEYDLIATIIDKENFSLAASGNGYIKSDSTNFSISNKLYIDHFYVIDEGDILYLSDLNSDINFSRDNSISKFDNLFGAITLNSERIVAGLQIDNLSADLIFNENKVYYNFYAEIDTTLKAAIDGNVEITTDMQTLLVNELFIDYKDIEWENRSPFEIFFYPDSIRINELNISKDSTIIILDGLLSKSGENNINLSAEEFPGNILGLYTIGVYDKNFFAKANMNTTINGTLKEPLISVDLDINDITFGSNKFGNLACDLNYKENNLNVSFHFLDTLYNYDSPYFTAKGDIPINLGIQNNNGGVLSENQMKVEILAEKFNLSSLGNIIPTVNNQKGSFVSDITVRGTLDKPRFNGFLEVNNGSFRSELNNLDYNLGLKLLFEESAISIDKFEVSNGGAVTSPGTLVGKGFLDFNLENPQIELSLEGDLTLLNNQSRSVSPNIYGDLYVGSDRPWKYSYKNERSNFEGDIVIKAANLIFSPSTGGYGSSNTIQYNILIDSSKIDEQKLKFKKLVQVIPSELDDQQSRIFSNFDFDTNIKIENDARLVFILSKTLNQRLTVEVEGNLKYTTIDGLPTATGEFNLLQGSKLDFFKSLEAEGSIRFESDISNPFIDVVAIYRADYYPPSSEEIIPTAVKIKIESSAQELSDKLSQASENVRVYSGTRNIDNDVPDDRYNEVDAISFILIGKFPDDFVNDDRTNLAQNASSVALDAAGSVLGNALTSLVNSQVGDLVNDIQFSNTGDKTRVSVSGRIKNIRYSIGGSYQESVSNISLANVDVKIEYPIIPKLLLRVERRDAITRQSTNEEKVEELGLKYLFIF